MEMVLLTSFADKLSEAFDKLMPFDELSEVLLRVGIDFWNAIISVAYVLLGINVEEFAGGEAYHLLQTIMPVFYGVASTLTVLFFFYGFYEESFEDRKNDIWGMARSIGMLIVTVLLVTNSNTVLSGILTICSGIMSLIANKGTAGLQIDSGIYIADFQNLNLGLGLGLIMLLLSLITMLVLLLCAGIIVYVVYFRYIKVLLCMPFAPLALSTLCANREVQRTTYSYVRYFIALASEVIAIMLALILCNAILSGGIPELLQAISTVKGNSSSQISVCIMDCFAIIFTCCLTVGSVKGAEQLMTRIIG